MGKIYITGHRNPDLDSVCSAYAYAVLKNQIDKDNNYIPVRCGHLGESAKKILGNLNINVPAYKRDVFPKVMDVLLNPQERIDVDCQLDKIAENYDDSNPSVIPVYDEGKFYGLLSVDDITNWVMNTLSEKGLVDRIPRIREIMRDQEEPIFVNDLFEDAKSRLSSSKKRGLAVVDENGFAGYVTRRCFLKAPRYNVILVDHNEPKQSIIGIETANIVEIIDHHRLDAVKTNLPIFIDAEPLGSTCTIVYQLFVRNGVTPDKDTAKVLLTGIISDTLILKSPTTTMIDKNAAAVLAEICGVNYEEYGLSMFNNMEGLKNSEPEKAISSDFKTYTEKGAKLGIGQCEVTTLDDIDDYKEAYLAALEAYKVKRGLDWAVLMVTDVLAEHSILLCTDYKANKHLQYEATSNLVFDMPGVMSRKKQLLPEMLHAVGA